VPFNVPYANISFTIIDQVFLETLLLEIRGKTISYASFIKKKEGRGKKNLLKVSIHWRKIFVAVMLRRWLPNNKN
jgi:hypothetical protein